MNFKKNLSIFAVLMSITTMGLIRQCTAMESCHDIKSSRYVSPYTSKCIKCGRIDVPRIKLIYPGKVRCYCKQCKCVEHIGKKLFIPWVINIYETETESED